MKTPFPFGDGTVLRDFWSVLSPHDRRLGFWVFAGMIVGMLIETLSIGAIIPALSLFTAPGVAGRSATLEAMLETLGNPSQGLLVVGGLILLLALYAIKSLVLLGLAWQQARFLASVRRDISERLFETYLTQPWTFHLQRNSAQLIRNATTEVTLFVQGCHGLLGAFAEGCVTVGIALLLVWIEPVASIVVGVTLAIATWALQATMRARLLRWGEMRQQAEGLRVKALQQGLGGIRDVKVFGREKEFMDHFRAAERQATHAMQMQTFSVYVPRLWYELLAVAGVTVLGFVLFLQGVPAAQLVPRLGLFAVAAFRLMPSLNRIVLSLQMVQFLKPAVEVLSTELGHPAASIPMNDGSRLTVLEGIHLRGVTFAYPGSHDLAIDSVSLSIPRGAAVGIIGESGAGKSTLIDLLLGLLEPVAGTISVDDHDVRADLRCWQNSIGYVPQAIFLTDDTIRANVAFGVPEERIDGEAVRRCLAAAQLDRFVDGLPEGADTMVGERGVRLSGGQMQRIGIARALYWDPPILVLDEATSSLDTATESGVMEAVNRLHGAKTLIIIAHRMSTLGRCDQIFHLSGGRLTPAPIAATHDAAT